MDLAETKREIIAASQPKGGRPPNDGAKEPTPNLEPVSKNDRSSDAKIGKIAGVSRDTVMKYRRAKEAGEENPVNSPGLRCKPFGPSSIALTLQRAATLIFECTPESVGVRSRAYISRPELPGITSPGHPLQ